MQYKNLIFPGLLFALTLPLYIESSNSTFTGRVYWYNDYERIPDNIGACGKEFNFDNYIALNYELYNSGKDNPRTNYSNYCGKCIKVVYNNKYVVGKITDRCPRCKNQDIEICLKMFKLFENEDVGFIQADWSFVSCDLYGKMGVCSNSNCDESDQLKNNTSKTITATTTIPTKSTKKTFIIIGSSILGGIIAILVTGLVTFKLIKKKSKKQIKSDFSSSEEFRNGSIKVVLNKNNIKNSNSEVNNNSNNNEKVEINKNSKDIKAEINNKSKHSTVGINNNSEVVTAEIIKYNNDNKAAKIEIKNSNKDSDTENSNNNNDVKAEINTKNNNNNKDNQDNLNQNNLNQNNLNQNNLNQNILNQDILNNLIQNNSNQNILNNINQNNLNQNILNQNSLNQNILNQNFLNQNILNNLNQNNLNQNILNQNSLNQNTINSNDFIINTLLGRNVFIYNFQNSGDFVMSSMPLFNSNINNNQNNNGTQGAPSYEENEPLPEYSDVDKSMAKQQFM